MRYAQNVAGCSSLRRIRADIHEAAFQFHVDNPEGLVALQLLPVKDSSPVRNPACGSRHPGEQLDALTLLTPKTPLRKQSANERPK